jgi:hypothetical protein
MDKSELSIGIIGSIGLGLLLGSEFSGRFSTILGAIVMIISFVAMAYLSYKSRINSFRSE